MFKSITRIAYPVHDISKAREWYRSILNAEPVHDSPLSVVFAIGDSWLILAPAADVSPGGGDRVVAFWEVEDADEAYHRLIEAGAAPHAEVLPYLTFRYGSVIDPFGNIIGVTSAAASTREQPLESQPSYTAHTVAFCRALSASEDRKAFRGQDTLAEIFIAENGRRPLHDPAARAWVMEKLIDPGVYEFLIARTAWLDRIFVNALRGNIPQIVFLGAGYDTRSYRFASLIRDTRVFELDMEPTQLRKRECLSRADVPVPEQVTFVSVNFNRDTLASALSSSGFDRTRKTLFIWEGVMYYLSIESIDQTLSFVKKNSPAGSEICFDYRTVAPEIEQGNNDSPEIRSQMKTIRSIEPIRFWIGAEEIEAFMTDRKFQVVEHLNPEDMEREFLRGDDGGVEGNVAKVFGFVRGEV